MTEVTHKKISYEIFSKVNDFFKKVVTKISDGGGSFQSTVKRLSGKTLFFDGKDEKKQAKDGFNSKNFRIFAALKT